MSDRGQGHPHSMETPLLANRTLTQASTTTSKLPQRRPSLSQSDYPHGVTMTAGRLPAIHRQPSNGSFANAPATVSRLPTRKPSLTGLNDGALPGTASRLGTLKRTSSAAGLQQESELSTLKRQLSRLQSQLEDQSASHSRALLEVESDRNTLTSQVATLVSRNERLERHRATLLSDKKGLEERLSTGLESYEKELVGLRKSEREARGELRELREEKAELESELRETQHEYETVLRENESERMRMEALEKEVEEWKGDLERERILRVRVEEERDRAVLEKGSSAVDDGKNELVREELHRQVTHLRSLEKENSRLQRRLETFEKQHANIEILKETNRSLEKKARGVEGMRAKVVELEGEVEGLKRERMEWSSFLDKDDKEEMSTPRKITKSLAALQIENRTLKATLESRQIEMSSRTRMVGELERRVEALEEEGKKLKSELGKMDLREKQGEGEKGPLKKEVEMLKRHLATYETEESAHSTSYDAQKSARISELENLLAAHQREVAELAKQVGHWRGLVERYGGSTTEIVGLEEKEEDSTGVVVKESLEEVLRTNEGLEVECARLRDGHEMLLKELESLELLNDRLTYDHQMGAYDPSTTKVLEFRQNPDLVEHAVRTETLERLREENKDLLKGGGEMVPRSSWVNSQKELEEALAAVKQKEILEDRTKKAFQDKANEFRKVVFSLLGYRLDFLSDGRVKLSSAYAPSKDHSLLFRSLSGDTGTMELIGAGSDKVALSEEVRSQMQFWVQQRQSIPGFLAALTLTMFEATTRGGAAGFVLGD